MRTLSFIVGGCVLLAVCLGVARLLPAGLTVSSRSAIIVFLVIWLVVAAANMWAGVARAGYSVAEEFPIFLVIFCLPAIVAIFVKWKT
jgi:hypothetical protein